jgi:hypothetical protein
MGEYIRLPDGEQLKLGTCGDWRYVRLAEARGLLLDLTRKASRHPHDTDLAHALGSAWVWTWRFPWPWEDGASVDDIDRRNMFEAGPFPLLIPVKIARRLEHDHVVSHVTRKGGGYGVNVWHRCPNAQDTGKRSTTPGVYFDVHCERETEGGDLFTVLACTYCRVRHAFTKPQIAEIRRANEPAPGDPSERAAIKRKILERLRGCRRADRV